MNQLPDALAALAAYRQFVVCQFVPDLERPGKTFKYPLNIYTGQRHDAHESSIWVDADTAVRTAAAWGAGYGVGFTFTEQDPFFFIDIDECVDASGAWTPIVAELCAELNGAAVETSQSGRGLHIIGTGSVTDERRCKDKTNQLFDLYTKKRFVALGCSIGMPIVGNASTEHSAGLGRLVERHLQRNGSAEGKDYGWTVGRQEGRGPDDDTDLLRRAMASTSAAAAFGSKASFKDLFDCNVEVLAKVYPPDGNSHDAYGASEADRALAQHLMFWTGKDCERTERIMRMSALVRAKWDDREDYLTRTIMSAIRVQGDVISDKEPEPLVIDALLPATDMNQPGERAKAVMIEGSTYSNVSDQMIQFAGCTYVFDENRILTQGGLLLKSEQFRVLFGGYSFVMSAENDRTSRDAYEAFTQSQAIKHPRADSTCFKPDRAPGEIIRDAGRSRVNTWWPVDVPRQVGDVTPFLTHMAKLLPDERDRMILLSYMAACVQHKGYKFQWAPLLQGVEGNGKTLLTRCVAEAIGKRYVHWPKASKLAKEFNAWMRNKLFYGVEDIYVGGNRRDVIEELKPMITGDDLEIEGKGVDQVTSDICGNFMFNSNHKDAIIKTRNDRRFAVLYAAQQHESDLRRDGMDSKYMHGIYNWLKSGGYAIVAELLHTFPIPDEFNPATSCQRAPTTTSTEEAISESLGSIEQDVLEAIAQGTPGFAGGWVSSMALDDLLVGRRVSRNKRRDMMTTLGYSTHPGLPDGRVNNVVMPDSGRPRLYILNDHAARHIAGAAEIARAYSQAQVVQPVPSSFGA